MDKISRDESRRIGFLRTANPLAIAMVSMTRDALSVCESDDLWSEFDSTVPARFE